MKILHIDLQERGSNSVEFRFFWDNPNQTRTYTRFLSEIDHLSEKADTDYYTRLPEDHAKTGQETSCKSLKSILVQQHF